MFQTVFTSSSAVCSKVAWHQRKLDDKSHRNMITEKAGPRHTHNSACHWIPGSLTMLQWKGPSVNKSCGCGTGICGRGCLPSSRLVYRLTIRAWEPLSLAKTSRCNIHTSTTGCLYWDEEAKVMYGPRSQTLAAFILLQSWGPMSANTHTHTHWCTHPHTHTGPCMYHFLFHLIYFAKPLMFPKQ